MKKAVSLLTNAGYKEFDPKASYKPGDKIYWVNRKKAIIASTIGTKDLNEGLRMNGAHIDSPRLALYAGTISISARVKSFSVIP